MNGVIAITVLMLVYALGELIAEKTKAILSSTLVIAVVLLVAFWMGLPKDIFQTSAISSMGMILVSFLITSIGSKMDFAELKQQWKTVIISIVGVIVGVGIILIVAPLVIGQDMAIAGAPIFAGGNAAALIMKDALEATGRGELYQFCLMLLVTQKFIGVPIASFLLKKEARIFIGNKVNIALFQNTEKVSGKELKRKPLQLPKLFDKPSIVFVKLGIVAALAHFVSGLTKGRIHPFIMALLLGVVFSQLGFLERDVLEKTGSASFILFTTTVVIFSNLADTTPRQIVDMLIPLLVVLVVGVVGVILAGFVAGKILKVSPYLAIALGLTCTFGFPTTMFMPEEISSAVGKTDEERTAILNYLSSKMIVAGFITVTIASVIIAGVFVQLL